MQPGRYLHIVADGDVTVPHDILDRITVNKAQAGAVIKALDGEVEIANIDGNEVGTKEYMCKTDGPITISVSGFTSCDITAIVRRI